MKKIILFISAIVLISLIYLQLQNKGVESKIQSSNSYEGPNSQSYLIE